MRRFQESESLLFQQAMAALGQPFGREAYQWRADGRPKQFGQKWAQRYVAYLEAQQVAERLDAQFIGDWSLATDLIPSKDGVDANEDGEALYVAHATLTVGGVSREDVGEGTTPKGAATDAFKRAAARFGIGREMYGFGMNWVPVEDGSKYPKPLKDPGQNYWAKVDAKALGRTGATTQETHESY